MNQFVTAILVALCLAWLVSVTRIRKGGFAFPLWFPLTAFSLVGAFIWGYSVLALLFVRAHDEAEGWALFGAALVAGYLLICPIVLAISIWRRPLSGSYSARSVIPTVLICALLPFLYGPISAIFENQQLRLVVLDANKHPIANAMVEYASTQRSFQFAFPASSVHGQKLTGADGSVMLPVPQTHELDCKITAPRYATLTIRSDRAWGRFTWRQTWIGWQFPPENPAKPWEIHGGSVQTDVDVASVMNLTVYMLSSISESIPHYGPVRIYHDEPGTTPGWTSEASVTHTQ